MNKQLFRLLMAVLLVFSLATTGATEGRAASITVHFDKDLYIVNGPGDEINVRILIDVDPIKEGDQPVREGLFSHAIKMSFSPEKADIGSLKDIKVPGELDFFGFGAPAFVEVAPRGEVGVHANVDQFNSPLLGYNDTLLATVTLINLASEVDRYPLLLGFNRDLGRNEDFFVDMNGTTLDSEIMFIPSRVVVRADFPGDVDQNGTVDGADFLIFASNYGLTDVTLPNLGDLNQDGSIGLADLLLIQKNFGNTQAGSPGVSSAAVPEPSTLGLLLMALLLLGLAIFVMRNILINRGSCHQSPSTQNHFSRKKACIK